MSLQNILFGIIFIIFLLYVTDIHCNNKIYDTFINITNAVRPYYTQVGQQIEVVGPIEVVRPIEVVGPIEVVRPNHIREVICKKKEADKKKYLNKVEKLNDLKKSEFVNVNNITMWDIYDNLTKNEKQNSNCLKKPAYLDPSSNNPNFFTYDKGKIQNMTNSQWEYEGEEPNNFYDPSLDLHQVI